MRRFRVFGALLGALTVLLALGASSAMAVGPLGFLPNTKNAIETGSVGAGELTTLGSGIGIKCTGGTVTGEITAEDTALVNVHFTTCTALGFQANSLPDGAGIILTGNLTGELCVIKTTPTLEIGLFISGADVHIEVPSLGVLLIVKGSIIGHVTPLNIKQKGIFVVDLKTTGAGDQDVVKCTDLKGVVKTASLTANKDAAHTANESAGIKQRAEIEFEKEVEVME